MFRIDRDEHGTIRLDGRLDAASVAQARVLLDEVQSSCRLDFSHLEYIASAGLGLLAAVQRRLLDRDQGLTLCGLSPHLRDVLNLAGFEGVFEFE